MSTPFLVLAAHCRQLPRFFHVSERQRLILEVLIDYSYALGQNRAHVPTLDLFTSWTGIDPSSARKVLLDLYRLRALVWCDTENGEYELDPDGNRWLFQPRRIAVPAQQLVAESLLADDDSVRGAMAAISRQTVLARPVAGHRIAPLVRASSRGSSVGDSPMNVVGDSPTEGAGIYSGSSGNRNNPKSITPIRPPPVGGTTTAAEDETYLLGEIGRLCGQAELARNGGAWRLRIREGRKAVVEALAATKLNRANIRTTAAKYLNRCWRNERRRTILPVP